MAETWLKCSACKNPISFGAKHWVCSVSTCNRPRTRLVFCTVPCWDSHVAILRHRDAWAVDARAPSAEQWAKELADNPPEHAPAAPATPVAPAVRRMVGEMSASAASASSASAASASSAGGTPFAEVEREVLIVVSKMKKYIKERSGMNCSDAVADAISDHVRAVCDDAIRAAAKDERKTVLDRDVPKPIRGR